MDPAEVQSSESIDTKSKCGQSSGPQGTRGCSLAAGQADCAHSADFGFVVFGLDGGLNSRLHTWAMHPPQVHFALVILEMRGEGLTNILPGLALNFDPPDLSLPSS
jgi:hypothetical protein